MQHMLCTGPSCCCGSIFCLWTSWLLPHWSVAVKVKGLMVKGAWYNPAPRCCPCSLIKKQPAGQNILEITLLS